jgi:hypothetical protein
MGLSSHLLQTAVVATAEICADPFPGGTGEPDLCRLQATQEVATPFFSLIVEPEFLVGIDRGGRRILLMPSYRQSPVHMQIEVVEDAGPLDWPDCPKIIETVEENVTWQDCRISAEGIHKRRLAARLKNRRILIQYWYSTSSAEFAPALERMTQSARIHAI